MKRTLILAVIFLIFTTLTTAAGSAKAKPEAMPRVPAIPVMTNSLRENSLCFFMTAGIGWQEQVTKPAIYQSSNSLQETLHY